MYIILWNDENEDLCKVECNMRIAAVSTVNTVIDEGHGDNVRIFEGNEINIFDFINTKKLDRMVSSDG